MIYPKTLIKAPIVGALALPVWDLGLRLGLTYLFGVASSQREGARAREPKILKLIKDSTIKT